MKSFSQFLSEQTGTTLASALGSGWSKKAGADAPSGGTEIPSGTKIVVYNPEDPQGNETVTVVTTGKVVFKHGNFYADDGVLKRSNADVGVAVVKTNDPTLSDYTGGDEDAENAIKGSGAKYAIIITPQG